VLFRSRVSGARLHANYIRPGGVSRDISDELLEDISFFVKKFCDRIDDLETMFTDNRIFKQRLVGIGIVSKEEAIDCGFSGPMIRGSGLPWDLRKSQPYEVYDELTFDIPIGKNGDCYDRYLIRILEMRESVKLVEQCIANMPDGSVMTDNMKVAPPSRDQMKHSMEAMIHHFKLYSEGYSVPSGECYAAIEAPKGEFGVYLISDGSNKPYRCHVRAPSFAHLQATEMMVKGHTLSDVVAVISSQDIVLGEIDR